MTSLAIAVREDRMTQAARVLTGPLPVLVVGAVIAASQAAGRIDQPEDLVAYWRPLDALYSATWFGETAAYVYPPPLAQAMAPLHLLGWPLAVFAWQLLLFGALWYALRWLALPAIVAGFAGLAIGLPLLGNVLGIVVAGNVQMLVVAGAVAGLRYPEGFAIGALTKVGPAVGLLWHRPRGMTRGIAVIAAVAAVSFALSPSLWFDWLRFVTTNAGAESLVPLSPVPFVVRLPVALVAMVWATRTHRAWVVPLAVAWSLPALYAWGELPFLLAALGLYFGSGAPSVTRRATGTTAAVGSVTVISTVSDS